MDWPYWLAAAIVVLAIVFFGVKAQINAWRQERKDAADKIEEKQLEQGADNPEIDETYAGQLALSPSIEQVARNKGAV